MSYDEDAYSVESLDYIRSISPPAKDESYKGDIWNRRRESLDYTSDLSPSGNEGSLESDALNPTNGIGDFKILSDKRT